MKPLRPMAVPALTIGIASTCDALIAPLLAPLGCRGGAKRSFPHRASALCMTSYNSAKEPAAHGGRHTVSSDLALAIRKVATAAKAVPPAAAHVVSKVSRQATSPPTPTSSSHPLTPSPALPGSTSPPRSGRAIVVQPQMTPEELTSLLQDVLARIAMLEGDVKRVKRQTKSASGSERRASKYVIDRRATTYGAAVAGAFCGIVLGWSVLPNLWLVGGVAGAAVSAYLSSGEKGKAGDFCRNAGIQVALVYKDVKDFYDQTIFLYHSGKLSYTYWRVWEKYDREYQLTDKYNAMLAQVSSNAAELDRQYQIRRKVIRGGRQAASFAKRAAATTAAAATTVARQAAGWGGEEDDDGGDGFGGGSSGRRQSPLGRFCGARDGDAAVARKRGGYTGGSGGRGWGWMLGIGGYDDPYSPLPKGRQRRRSPDGSQMLPDFLRHMLMTKRQRRLENEKKFRVKFLGRRDYRPMED